MSVGLKQSITTKQFLDLDLRTQELLFNILYSKPSNSDKYSGLYFKHLTLNGERSSIESVYMNGVRFPYDFYVDDVCKGITIGILIEALIRFGSLRMGIVKNYDDDDRDERSRCDLNFDYYSEGCEFEAQSFELIDALLNMLNKVCIKKVPDTRI